MLRLVFKNTLIYIKKLIRNDIMDQIMNWKKNKFFIILSVLTALWIAFIIILGIQNRRIITFFDTIALTDVSSEYVSELSILRYIMEPFVAMTFILEWEFTWLFSFLLFYPIGRVIYIYLKKHGKFQSIKFSYLGEIISDMLNFCFKIFSAILILIFGFIVIGFLVQGFFFVNRYFMVPIQLGIHIGYLLILGKALYIFLRLIYPKISVMRFNKLNRIFNLKFRISIKRINTIKKEFIYIAACIYLLLGANIILISFKFPNHHIKPINPLPEDEFLFDFHVHTIMSDGWLTPEERVLWYIENGISGAVFSDHDNIRGALIARDFVERNNLPFKVFIGEEWTDHMNDIHINYFGLEEEIVPLESYTLNGPKAMNASDLIAYVKANNGYITVNHYNYDPNPNGGFGVPYNLTQLKNWGIDGFEIVNGGRFTSKYQQIRQFCLANNLTCIGGSDIHINEDLNTFVRIKLADPTNLTISNIFETMKANTHEVVAIQFYPEIVKFPSELNDFGFYILEGMINYFLNMDIFQALSWIGWTIFIYILIILVYRKIKLIAPEKLNLKIK